MSGKIYETIMRENTLNSWLVIEREKASTTSA